VAVQAPIAVGWSVGWQYALESRRRKKLRQAFAGYLSPHLADRIANEDFDLSLGGKVVEATVMFTDLEGFTTWSEGLNPTEVSTILTTYFNQTTRGILKQEGTIIKYMGDAVMAVWGTPLPESKHAQRAVLAGWEMIQAGRTEIAGRILRTRVGINSGKVLAGNLGSDFRFDYAAIGDTTNLASRLEGLNKYLKTELLVSEATRQQLDSSIQTRALGQFLLAGKQKPVTVHEVFGVGALPEGPPEWVALFTQAMARFVAKELDAAEKLFEQVIAIRREHDGPSEFYLGQIAEARQTPTHTPWTGVISLSSK
jgi:adenylate cyclase